MSNARPSKHCNGRRKYFLNSIIGLILLISGIPQCVAQDEGSMSVREFFESVNYWQLTPQDIKLTPRSQIDYFRANFSQTSTGPGQFLPGLAESRNSIEQLYLRFRGRHKYAKPTLQDHQVFLYELGAIPR